jgi:hypothetical protein
MKWLRRYLDKSSCDIERCSKSRHERREARDGMGVAQPQRAPSIWPILGQMTRCSSASGARSLSRRFFATRCRTLRHPRPFLGFHPTRGDQPPNGNIARMRILSNAYSSWSVASVTTQ